MTSFRIERLAFDNSALNLWQHQDKRHTNWPVVYALNGTNQVYIGETLRGAGRLAQHLASPSKSALQTARVIVDETFNKSVCLDLESYLIRLFAGDGKYEVLNANAGITDRDYYNRESYQEIFRQIFDKLRSEGLFSRHIKDIENDDLFKLSPFKALTEDQAAAIADIVEGLLEDLNTGLGSTVVVQGDPGTGKTIVGIFLIKLLHDIQSTDLRDEFYGESLFSEYFLPDHAELLRDLKVGLVIPQQSLRDSIRKVFARTPKLSASMVLTPFEVGFSETHYDLLIVDEAHRLNQRASQPSAEKNRQFGEINKQLFGTDDVTLTQIDWIKAKSTHQVLLLDAAQSVRTADLPEATLRSQFVDAQASGRVYRLHSQMRVQAGGDYIQYVRELLSGTADTVRSFAGYDFLLFDNLGTMRDAIHARDAEYGLARVVAGYAWPWLSKNDKSKHDIIVDGCSLRWNRRKTDWVSSKGSLDEVGSIHTVQGYDLNYAGVIIGGDLRFEPGSERPYFDRARHFDKKGIENNRKLGVSYSDDDLLRYIINIYSVLMTRGMKGTYVYAVDPTLRAFLSRFIPAGQWRA
jgi:uncharacterized protein